MPLRDGNLTSLARATDDSSHDELCKSVLEQMLKALDHLDYNNFCHRDVKPDNILYRDMGDGQLNFQLADFGLANHSELAKTLCGTGYYFQAPELYPLYGDFPQTPRMDVWSFVATVLAAHTGIQYPPVRAPDFNEAVRAVLAAVTRVPKLRPMARVDPTKRASAGRMLMILFDGKGLTTAQGDVPPLVEEEEQEREARLQMPQAGSAGPPSKPAHSDKMDWQY